MKYLLFLILSFQIQAVELTNSLCSDATVFCPNELHSLLEQGHSIESLVPALPWHLKRNVTFKRGNNMEKRLVGILGPHGHKVSPFDSGSASPEQPRAFVWDETTGVTLSWNSGNPAHRAHNRIDIYDFDFVNNKHRLYAWFPKGEHDPQIVGADFTDVSGRSCIKCHGAVQRPIFPMYPDWPRFYGEFNDEMTGYARPLHFLKNPNRVCVLAVETHWPWF